MNEMTETSQKTKIERFKVSKDGHIIVDWGNGTMMKNKITPGFTFRIKFNGPHDFKKETQYEVEYWEEGKNPVKAKLYFITRQKSNYNFSNVNQPIEDGLEHLSNFGILGYGINAIENEPTKPIMGFTYENESNSFTWGEQKIQLPDQIDFDPTPSGKTIDDKFSSKITTAREFQSHLKTKVGLSEEDPETDLTFSGEARYANETFSSNKGKQALEVYLHRADISFLKLSRIRYDENLLDEVVNAIEACGTDPQKITGFYDTYGTHVLKSAHIGGQLNIKTSVKIDSNTNKEISTGKIKIDSEVKMEDEDYIKGKIKFDTRDQNTSKLYREISTIQLLLIGGDVTTKDEEAWRESLLNSNIPVKGTAKNVHGHGFVSSQDYNGKTNLGLVLLAYTEIYNVIGLDEDQKSAFEEAFKDYLHGVNPFEEKPQRLMPDMKYDYPISIAEIDKAKKKGIVPPNRQTFSMRGYMATYVTSAGLCGKPGSWVDVKCKCDVWDEWTKKRIYAGEVLTLRDKTPYVSTIMFVEVDAYGGDNEAVIYTNHELVSW